ncbi:MAG: LuxR C-terminal-related transcriptional regulator [Intrasporangium sp.]|uniref:LuxR C-terminal-related transcriptional regulator n=1 Tax=Intrasporangium sp. TaxID=1925024 RepID=UPI003F7D6AA4
MSGGLSDPALRALRHADQVIRETDRNDVFRVYDACRAAVGAIAPLDDFYIALVTPADRRVSYPYLFTNDSFEEAGSVTYGPNGLTAWMLASRRPYRFSDDDGALLNRGNLFGDADPSSDALVVPLLGLEDGEVMGLMGALSDTPNAFADETMRAMEWLAGLVVDRLQSGHPNRRLNLRLVYPELEDDGRSGRLTALNAASRELTELAAALTELARGTGRADGSRAGSAARPGAGSADPELRARLLALSRRCFEIQASLVTRLGPQDDVPTDPLAVLSPRERSVVDLLTGPDGDPGNAGIAAALGISPATVKTHMSSLLEKLGLEHRSELRWLVRSVGRR